MDIATIADEDTLLGFKLAGIKDGAVFSEETVKDSLEKFRDAKIIIMTEKVSKYLREQNLLSKFKFVIAEVPDKSGSTGEALANLSRMFEEAIGVKLKEKKE